MTAKKGYAYRKALEIEAWEHGKRDKPVLPKSKSKMGAINRWRKALKKGYIPRQSETQYEYTRNLIKYDIGLKRPVIKIQNQYFSKRKGMGFSEVIFGIYNDMLNGKNERYIPIDNVSETNELLEELYSIAEKLIGNNSVQAWNREFRKMGISGKVSWIRTLT